MAGHGASEWQGAAGDRWRQNLDGFEWMIAGIGDALVAQAGYNSGDRVVDVGCGGGATTLPIARIVGAQGLALGVDIAPQLIEIARDRAAAQSLSQAQFLVADGQSAVPDQAPFDRLFSRFGVMFFDDSIAAFANMRQWLKPGGRIDFACWGPPARNPWMSEIHAIMAQFVEMPPRDPAAPGPFRFADPDTIRTVMDGSGFQDVSIESHIADQPFGGRDANVEAATDFVLTAMDMGALLDDAGSDVAVAAKAAITGFLKQHEQDGVVILPGFSWFVSARA